MDIAVQVKRGISELWKQTDRAPYTDLFNEKLTSVHVWKAVKILRAVDEELQPHRNALALMLAAWFAGTAVPTQWIYLPSIAGFIGMALANVACEHFNIWATNLDRRLRGKRQQ
jgi:hypothetical protein